MYLGMVMVMNTVMLILLSVVIVPLDPIEKAPHKTKGKKKQQEKAKHQFPNAHSLSS